MAGAKSRGYPGRSSIMTSRETLSERLLPEVCISLRMALNGSAEPLGGDDVDRWVAYLETRLRDWRPSPVPSPVDEAVRCLVAATLLECADLRSRLPRAIGGERSARVRFAHPVNVTVYEFPRVGCEACGKRVSEAAAIQTSDECWLCSECATDIQAAKAGADV